MKKQEQDCKPVSAEAKAEFSAKWDQPSQAPGFEGATPQELARAVFRLVRQPTT